MPRTPRRYDDVTSQLEGSAAALYHENSKLNVTLARPFAEHVGEVSADEEVVASFVRSQKTYPGHERIPLSKLPVGDTDDTLDAVLGRRRSCRVFSQRPVPCETMARLLERAAGETARQPLPGHPDLVQSLRASPSAGGLNSIEVYPVLLSVDGAQQGIYHYCATDHHLECLADAEAAAQVFDHLVLLPGMEHAALVLLLTGVTSRLRAKYGERGYRFLLLDAGHLAQNFLLVAQALGLGAVCLGGYHDNGLDGLLGLDGRNEVSLYPILVGWGDGPEGGGA